MGNFGKDESVKIDVCHADLIFGLVTCFKPEKILELGIGGGRSTDSILRGLKYNLSNFDYTLVDNWLDFNGVMPIEISDKYKKLINIITSNEKDFIFSTNQKFDFIMSDADHNHTNEWFEYVYENILKENGILIYHDVNLFDNQWANLRQILEKCKQNKINHFLFNKNSRFDERCHRGLLVIFKNI